MLPCTLNNSSYSAFSCARYAQYFSPVDIADLLPSQRGIFDFYTYEKLKGYYALYWYGFLYDCEKEILAENSIENVYSLCGVDNNGKATIILTYYSDNDSLPSKNISLELGKKGTYEIYRVDNEHNGELTEITDKLSFNLELFSIVLIREK